MRTHQEESVVYGSLKDEGLEVVHRDGRYFVRYDAGSHQTAWREDELTKDEYEKLSLGGKNEVQVILGLQHRIQTDGEDAYQQNWLPNQ